MKKALMYEIKGRRVPTWNPFAGCGHHCSYCYVRDIFDKFPPKCDKCFAIIPHEHPERLKQKFKAGETYFVCSTGDIRFASIAYFLKILDVIRNNPETTFYLQSKNPYYFDIQNTDPVDVIYILHDYKYPENLVLGTTIETNRTGNDYNVSDAPIPETRYCGLKEVQHTRTYIAIEPVMAFDLNVMLGWIQDIKPEFVYVGKDNWKSNLKEPTREELQALIEELREITEVRLKTI